MDLETACREANRANLLKKIFLNKYVGAQDLAVERLKGFDGDVPRYRVNGKILGEPVSATYCITNPLINVPHDTDVQEITNILCV